MFSEKDDNISDFANVSAITAACAVSTWQDQSPVAQVFQEMINARQEAGACPGHWTTLTR